VISPFKQGYLAAVKNDVCRDNKFKGRKRKKYRSGFLRGLYVSTYRYQMSLINSEK